MNFFEHQDRARKKTGLLVFLFLLAIVCIIVSAVAVVYVVLFYVAQQAPEIRELLKQPLWLPISCAMLIVILMGTLIRSLQVLGGGKSVANMVGALPIDPHHPSFEVKRFLNVVEEMAIASGVPVPSLYLLEDNAINAFVAGRKPQDTVMVVTQGALDNLNRQELQAVVGHEFSHIYNADMAINLRLIGLLGGILAIGQVGYFMIRFSGSGRTSRSRKGGGSHAAIILIGLGVFCIGYIGLFFGRIIKAAISRERELLADASSVQYTRNPQGLVSAFKTMQSMEKGTLLRTSHAEDVNHFCFAPAISMMFGNLLATHPPLAKRIQRIDPKGQYEQLPRDGSQEKETKAKENKAQEFFPQMLATSVIYATASQVKQSIGHPSDEHIDYAQALTTVIPEELRRAAWDDTQVAFLLYALILPEQLDLKAKALTSLRSQLSEQDIQKIVFLKGKMVDLPQAGKLPLLEFALPRFDKLEKTVQIQTYQNLYQIMAASEGDGFHYAMSILLAKRIKGSEAFKKEPVDSLQKVIREVVYLLVTLLQAGHQSEEDNQACFKKVTEGLFNKPLTLPKVQKLKFELLTKALQKINGLKPLEKEKVINACIDIVTFDNQVLVSEAELLRVVCEILECPLPPILSK